VGEEGLADADGADDGDVGVGLDEAQRAELGPQLEVESDLGRAVPRLELVLGVEVRLVSAELTREAVAAADLVGEQHEQEILMRGLLLTCQDEALGQRVEHRAELEALERVLEVGREGVGHDGSPELLVDLRA
jgi:hypothetical protein